MVEEDAVPLTLKVRSVSVKPIKDALEAHNLLDKSIKITRSNADEGCCNIPVKSYGSVKFKTNHKEDESPLCRLLSAIGMKEHFENVSSAVEGFDEQGLHSTRTISRLNHQEAAIDEWLKSIPSPVKFRYEAITPSEKKMSYTVYPPMLLLSPSSFSKYLLDEVVSSHLPRLHECLSKHHHITHVALNAPIPASSLTANLESISNIMRSPSGLTPLYGDFGPSLPADHIPTTSDFDSAFWCSTRQNGIFQTWAPRYSMFSRGNISEKARILALAKQRSSHVCHNATEVGYTAEDSTAVDLYAGIGYFAFSYVKAGLSRVFCWEINPWSVEALRRGAILNRWKVLIVSENEDEEMVSQKVDDENPRLVVFQESNEKAAKRVNALLSCQRPVHAVKPIRHVNCGYLPSSKDSWKTAVDILDKSTGGWIHVHENIAKSDIKDREAEIVGIFGKLAEGKSIPTNKDNSTESSSVSCEHIERVKSYAPGIMHCVLDMAIKPTY